MDMKEPLACTDLMPRPLVKDARQSVLGTVLHRLFGAQEAGWLVPLVMPYRLPLAGLLVLSMVAAGTALIPPWLTKLVIDQGLMAGNKQALIFYVAVLFGVGLAALGLGAINALVHLRFSARLLADLRRAGISRILSQSPRWQAEQKTGELMSRLDGDAGEIQQFAFAALVTGTGSCLRLLGGIVMLFVLSPALAMMALALAPVELVFFARARPVTHARARDVRTARGVLASGLAEAITGLSALRALNATATALRDIDQRQQGVIATLMSAQLWNEVTRAVPLVLTAILRGAVFLIGGMAVIDGTMPLGSLIAFTAYLGFLIGPMQSLISLWHGQARMRAALERFDVVMNAKTGVLEPAQPQPLPESEGASLDLAGVAYGPAGEQLLFETLSCHVAAGNKVRLSGASASGKSSLLGLLQRHDDPKAGQILLEGVDLRAASLKDLRSAVALVPQKGHVFSGTVATNLKLGCPKVSDKQMLEVLDLVELTDRFEAGGLNTVLGEGGLGLSGGERQRLCVARALLQPFKVLILDESLSEVDGMRVQRIVGRIDDRFYNRTRIIVTHGNIAHYGEFDKVIDLADYQPRKDKLG